MKKVEVRKLAKMAQSENEGFRTWFLRSFRFTATVMTELERYWEKALFIYMMFSGIRFARTMLTENCKVNTLLNSKPIMHIFDPLKTRRLTCTSKYF